jgi:hypothetical protein
MRDRFKVVEWGYFISQLQERGLTDVADISDALHFLANVGELSYFGSVMNDRQRQTNANSVSDGEEFFKFFFNFCTHILLLGMFAIPGGRSSGKEMHPC